MADELDPYSPEVMARSASPPVLKRKPTGRDPNYPNSGLIYIYRNVRTGDLKIGKANDHKQLKQRIDSTTTANPDACVLMLAKWTDEVFKVEGLVHKDLAQWNVDGGGGREHFACTFEQAESAINESIKKLPVELEGGSIPSGTVKPWQNPDPKPYKHGEKALVLANNKDGEIYTNAALTNEEMNAFPRAKRDFLNKYPRGHWPKERTRGARPLGEMGWMAGGIVQIP